MNDIGINWYYRWHPVILLNPIAMPSIPSSINGVAVDFAPVVNPNVDQRIVDALMQIVRPNIASGVLLERIYISSANDQHQLPSRHVQGGGKAVDISRINSRKPVLGYASDPVVTAIVDAMQQAFELTPHRRENFGPAMKKKLGADYSVSGHADHMHFSVN